MVKFKIIFGNPSSTPADVKMNNWLRDNPQVNVLSYQYQQARMGDHSICIVYEEETK